MAKKKGSAAAVSRFQARDAAPAAAFNPKASRSNKIQTAEEAFGGDEDECRCCFSLRLRCAQLTLLSLIILSPCSVHKNRDEVLFDMDGQETRGGMLRSL